MDILDDRLRRLSGQRFRAKFRLSQRDRELIAERGMPTIRAHAADLIGARLAPANPRNDGKQTPYRGHPVFVAQHATATCCRTCLAKWHGIAAGHDLNPVERDYVVEALCRWILAQYRASGGADAGSTAGSAPLGARTGGITADSQPTLPLGSAWEAPA